MIGVRVLGATLGALLLATGASGAMAQTPEPVERTAEMEQQAAALMALFPAELGGVSLVEDIQVDIGQELLADLDPSDEYGAQEIARIYAYVEAAGVTVDDAATAVTFTALDDETYLYMAAFQVRGGDAQLTVPLLLEAFQADMPGSRIEQRQIAEREVTLLYDDESPEAEPIVMVPLGEIVWLVSAPEPLLEEAVASFPGP